MILSTSIFTAIIIAWGRTILKTYISILNKLLKYFEKTIHIFVSLGNYGSSFKLNGARGT